MGLHDPRTAGEVSKTKKLLNDRGVSVTAMLGKVVLATIAGT
jgi:hypothetical protein